MKIKNWTLFERASPYPTKTLRKLANQQKARLKAAAEKELPSSETSKKDRKLRSKRLSLLENAVLGEPLLLAALRIRSRLPIKLGYETEVKEDVGAKEACDALAKNSGLDRKLMSVGFSYDTYGHGVLENRFWKNGVKVDVEKAIVDTVPARTIDYQRNRVGDIEFDKGRPVGYVQITDKFGDGTKYAYNDHKLAFMFNNPFGGYEPASLIESLYSTTQRLQNAEEGYAEYVYKKGFPFYTARVGTAERPPTDAEFDAVQGAFEDFRSATDYFVYPYPVELTMEDVGSVRDLMHVGDPFIDKICAGSGIPKPFLLGAAAGTELATSRAQIDILMDMAQNRQFEIGRFVENEIFKPFCELHEFSEVPKIIWKPIDLRDLKDLAASIRLLVGEREQQPVLTLKEARDAVSTLLKIDEKDMPRILPFKDEADKKPEVKRDADKNN